MRSAAEKSLSAYSRFQSVGAPAEDTGLPDASIDFVTAAQAFHWFDKSRFKSECRRILKPGGKVVLVWNGRDAASALVMENDAVNRAFCPNFTGFSGGGRGESPEAYSDFFKEGICVHKTFRYDLSFDEEGFIGRNMSSSYAPKETDSHYASYKAELARLYAKYSDGGRLCMPNLTNAFIGEV